LRSGSVRVAQSGDAQAAAIMGNKSSFFFCNDLLRFFKKACLKFPEMGKRYIELASNLPSILLSNSSL